MIAGRFKRTVLTTNRHDWSTAEAVSAYGQQHVERLLRGQAAWWAGASLPLDRRKLKVHPFYSMLSVSPLPHLPRKAQAA